MLFPSSSSYFYRFFFYTYETHLTIWRIELWSFTGKCRSIDSLDEKNGPRESATCRKERKKKKPKDPVASCAICRFFPFFFSLSGFFLFHQRDIGEKFVCNMFMLLTCSSADKEEKGEKKRKIKFWLHTASLVWSTKFSLSLSLGEFFVECHASNFSLLLDKQKKIYCFYQWQIKHSRLKMFLHTREWSNKKKRKNKKYFLFSFADSHVHIRGNNKCPCIDLFCHAL